MPGTIIMNHSANLQFKEDKMYPDCQVSSGQNLQRAQHSQIQVQPN